MCKRSDLNKIYHVENIPIFQNKVFPSQEEALKANTATVTLTQCLHCGFVFNKNFDTNLMNYDDNYQNEQNYSNYFIDYLHEILNIIKEESTEHDLVLEVGCGKGYFLEMIDDAGLIVTGFDPAYEGDNPKIIKDYFSEKYSDVRAELIILRHTLEHIAHPFDFLKTIAKAANYEGKIFIEVPCFDWIVSKNAFWDVFYEHCNYFTEELLASMFEKSGGGKLFNGQYIYLLADLKDIKRDIEGSEVKQYKVLFEKMYDDHKAYLKKSQHNLVWGAGAKGSTFVNILDPERRYVSKVIDINPNKQSKYIARTGHPIISPDSINFDQLSGETTIWIMNENYADEIKEQVNNTVSFRTMGELQ